ncbi:MAG: DNA polymerase I [Firmicutes bacterium]|nr:DNA polymerase I [Bacillota bacterium]
MKKLMIIDGNSIINRAFYAIPLLTNKDGEYTNAVYGFLNIFFKLYDEERPDYVGVTFDLPKPTFRHIKFDAYKGTRKGMPEELRPQISLLKEVLRKMNIKIYELEGYEADDVIGTLAKKTENLGIEPIIVSGDRDLLQIATDTIKIRIPKTKSGKTEIEDYYAKDVKEKYGVTPSEFIDVKALMGDSSDNVPGVPSIGEKTAIKIISEYSSVENAIENAENVKPNKAGENLIKFKEQALLCKFLVTIVTDAPIEFDEENSKCENMFNGDAFELFRKCGFKSLLNRFEAKEEKTAAAGNFKAIYTKEEAERFVSLIDKNESCACIIRENEQILGISFSQKANEAVFIGCGNGISEEELITLFKDYYEGEYKKIIHDAKEDIVLLKNYGINVNNLIFDTMIGAYILDSTRDTYDYNDIAELYLDENYISEEEFLGKGKSRISLKNTEEEKKTDFCCRKAEVLFRAKEKMAAKIEENEQKELYYDIELPLIYVLADMQCEGIKADKDELIVYRDELEKKIDELTGDIYLLAGEEFNINSPKQLSVILFEKLGLKGGKKTKTGWSTSADVLEKLKDDEEIVRKVLEYRTYAKLKSTYADGLLNVMDEKDGTIRSNFNQTVTATGRISSTEPNLQNIPIKLELGHKLRKVFKPKSEDFVFIDGDYSQIELRVLAHMAGDENLIKAFNDGADIHKLTASQVFNTPFDDVTPLQRTRAKAVNFGIIYGKQGFTLAQDLKISKKEADGYISGYFEKYPKIKGFLDKTIEDAEKYGYAKTAFNRRREIPEIRSSNFIKRSAAQRVAMNMPIQGTAADIIKIAMVKVCNRLKKENMRSKLILQVHDELLIETAKDEIDKVKTILTDEMENAVKLSVKTEIDVHEGNTWYDAK